jgi:hypothetical protein
MQTIKSNNYQQNQMEYRAILQEKIRNFGEEIIKLYTKDGIPISKIAQRFDISMGYIRFFLKQNDIKIIPYHANQYKINENYFENIDSHDKAYFLGLLASDGCVMDDYSIQIGLQLRDLNILEKFKKCLQSDAPIRYYKFKCKNKNRLVRFGGKSNEFQERYMFRFKNKKMCSDLIKHGIIPRKSLVLEFPKIDKQYQYSFMRGYIDGDGCICVYKDKKRGWDKFALVVISSKFFIQGMVDAFRDDSIKFSIKKANRCENTYRADACHKANVVAFLDKIYENCGENIFLDRKYEKYLEMKRLLTLNPVNLNRVTNNKHTHNF